MWTEEPEVVDFLQAALAAFHRAREHSAQGPYADRIVELGSYVMADHDPRPLFRDDGATTRAEYIGVDWRPGPGVDLVSLSHDAVTWELSGDQRVAGKLQRIGKRTADIVLSISALEHDPHWPKTLRAGIQMLKADSILAVSCPGPGWEEHELETAPGGDSYYRALAIEDLLAAITQVRLPDGVAWRRLEGWYDRRRLFSPHWPRACVIGWLASTPW